MQEIELILISQSEIFDYEEFSNLPLDRSDLFRELVYPRMIYYKNGFHSHLDIINKIKDGIFYSEADNEQKRNLLNIWDLACFNSIHIPGYLQQWDIVTKVINNFNSGWDDFCRIYDSCRVKPIVAISTTFYLSFSPVKKIISKLRDSYPDVEIVTGGAFINSQFISHGTEMFETQMRKNGINYLIHSFNSEKDLKDLIISKRKDENINNINNLCYFDGSYKDGKFHYTLSQWNPPVLDSIRNDFDLSDLPFLNHTVQIRTSCGCPYSCSFCSYPKIAGKFKRQNSECIRYLLNIISRSGHLRNIIFIDDTLNSDKIHFSELCRIMLNYHFEWFGFLRVNNIDEETVKLMKDSGCRGLFLGLESANESTLKIMNKKASVSQYTMGINLLKKYGILTLGAFIVGFPGDTVETSLRVIDFIDKSGLDYYKLEEFYYLHHTPIFEKREIYGLTGEGNNWKHSTMDYKTASILKLQIFKQVRNCTYIDSDSSLWSIAYLYDKGFSFEKIRNIQIEINKIVSDQIDGIYNDNHQSYNKINEMIAKTE